MRKIFSAAMRSFMVNAQKFKTSAMIEAQGALTGSSTRILGCLAEMRD